MEGKPHITIIFAIAVFLLTQIINQYHWNQEKKEIWNSLVQIQEDLNCSLEFQKQHLYEVQGIMESLLDQFQN